MHLKTILQILKAVNAHYALAGGLAYSTLVEPRATMDIDILILPEDIEELFHRLRKEYMNIIIHDQPMHLNSIRLWRAITFHEDREIMLDFLLAESKFHRLAVKRSLELDFMGIPLRVLSIEDLIILKRIANRAQDIADLKNINENYQNQIDWTYIDDWT